MQETQLPVQFWTYLLREDLLIPLGFMLLMVIVAVSLGWFHLLRHRADVELKRDMVARGMSAEEIERVLAAKSPKVK